MAEIRFGFRPYNEGFDVSDIIVEPVGNIDNLISRYRGSGQIWGRWFQLPLTETVEGKGRFSTVNEKPLVATGRYELPPSHILTHNRTNSLTRLRFLVQSIGFLSGMTILPEGYGHLTRFPAHRGVHGDFYGSVDEISSLIESFDRFHSDNKKLASTLMSSAIVHIQRSSSTTSGWDRFLFIYTALDALAAATDVVFGDWRKRLHPKSRRRMNHGALARDLCLHFRMPIAPRAKTFRYSKKNPNSAVGCRFSVIRNQLFHEGRYSGQPAGDHIDHELHESTLDLQNLCNRLVLALVGVNSAYVYSPITSRSMHSINEQA